MAKAVTAAQVVTFPSVCGHARETKLRTGEITTCYAGDQITDEGGSWFVGDLALSQLPLGELLSLRGRTANESTIGSVYQLRRAKVAIGKLLSSRQNSEMIHPRLATGLPVDHMRDASELKRKMNDGEKINCGDGNDKDS